MSAEPPADRPEPHHHTHAPGETVEAVEQALTEFADAAKQAAEAVNKRAGRDMFAATAVGAVLLALVGASLVWLPWGFVVFGAALAVGAQIEIGRALRQQRDVNIVYAPLLVGTVCFIGGIYGVQIHAVGLGSKILLGVVGVMAVVVMVWRLRGPMEGYVRDVGSTFFLFMYPAVLVSGLMLILPQPQGDIRIAIVVVGVAASDTGGHLVGMLIGKHKFSPRISPKKSWEGVGGSFLLSMILVALMTTFLLHQAWWKGVVLAAGIVVVGILGDLVESVIKRDLGIKDMSHLLPGHGGIMDRIDSYVLAAYPAWLLMLWLFPHG